MMSLSEIRRLSDEAAERAAEEKLIPYVPYSPEEVDRWARFPFPFIGSYVPDGWEKVEEWFCDSSGFGTDDEPALSVRRFKEVLKAYIRENPGHGFAVVEAGEFQVYVASFKKTRKGKKKSVASNKGGLPPCFSQGRYFNECQNNRGDNECLSCRIKHELL